MVKFARVLARSAITLGAVALIVVLVGAGSRAGAQDQPSTAQAARPAKATTPLSGLDVLAKRSVTPLSGVDVSPQKTCLDPRDPIDEAAPAPKLVSTYPADGQTVRPGILVLRLTFDLPMACRGSVGTHLWQACVSSGLELWRQSFDKRSLLIACDLKPKTSYDIWINQHAADHFVGLSGQEPGGYHLTFETSDEAPVDNAEEAMRRDPQLAALVKP